MKKKTIEAVGLFIMDSSGGGKIEILPEELPPNEGDETDIMSNKEK